MVFTYGTVSFTEIKILRVSGTLTCVHTYLHHVHVIMLVCSYVCSAGKPADGMD